MDLSLRWRFDLLYWFGTRTVEAGEPLASGGKDQRLHEDAFERVSFGCRKRLRLAHEQAQYARSR
jgi:hypothetical protein